MKLYTYVPAVGLLLFAARPASTLDDGLRFAPEEGTSLVKSFSLDGDLVLETVEVFVNGEEIDVTQMGMPLDFDIAFGVDVRCTDAYVSVADGRPLAFVRTYDEMTLHSTDPEGGEHEETADDILGEGIRFEWDEEAEVYERSFVGEGDEDDLKPLHDDLDLRALLPEDAGASDWEVGGARVVSVLFPGIDLVGMIDSDADIPDEVVEAIMSAIGGLELTCSRGGLVDVDGRGLVQIDVEGALDTVVALDVSSLLEEHDEMGLPTADFELSLEMEGEGLWDAEANHLHSFEMSSEGVLVVNFSMEVPEADIDVEGSAELSLTLEHVASVE